VRWIAFSGGQIEHGFDAAQDGDFAFDNETPRHKFYARPFELASRPVTNGDMMAFVADGGYSKPELWLSMGWDWLCVAHHGLPLQESAQGSPMQMFGDVWEWTQSNYNPYPGYKPLEGLVGEYNGKFMCNQFVLRGGSCATPQSHIRASYRNFFPPDARWQFSGLRLARDLV
jgi:formylglycine-generating enzyme required for sulfatase activity